MNACMHACMPSQPQLGGLVGTWRRFLRLTKEHCVPIEFGAFLRISQLTTHISCRLPRDSHPNRSGFSFDTSKVLVFEMLSGQAFKNAWWHLGSNVSLHLNRWFGYGNHPPQHQFFGLWRLVKNFFMCQV